MKRNRNVQNLIEYFADMFRPSGALGGSGHKQIRGSGWQKLWPMADMALAPEIMADASHPWKHCHARPSVMRGARELKAQSLSIGRRVFMKLLKENFGQESNIGLKDWTFPKRIWEHHIMLDLYIHHQRCLRGFQIFIISSLDGES